MEEDGKNVAKKKSDTCRLCFGTVNVTVHIGQQADKSTSVAEKIHYCTSLVVRVGDDFNQNICIACAENLDLMFKFKSKAIACDLELSKSVPRDEQFTYIQVSDDPLNMTYKLDLEEQDSLTDLVDSCVYNIIDGDELTIEPVNISMNSNKNTKTPLVDENESINTESIKCDDSQKQEVTINKSNRDLINQQQGFKTNDEKNNAVVDLKRNSTTSVTNEEKRKQKKVKIDNSLDDEKPSLIVKNGKVVYICGVCNFEAESMTLLLSHRSRVHLDNLGSYKCSECQNIYKTSGLLKRHTALHHDTHVCKHCNKRFSNKHSLERHINTNHNVTPLEFQCVKCSAYFDTLDKMEDHLVIHYMNPSNTFICNHCDRSFATYAAKNKHIDLEHMIEVECDICHVVLPTKEAMDKHNNSVHQPKKKDNKTYACTTCGKYFSTIKDILVHRETHVSIQ